MEQALNKGWLLLWLENNFSLPESKTQMLEYEFKIIVEFELWTLFHKWWEDIVHTGCQFLVRDLKKVHKVS